MSAENDMRHCSRILQELTRRLGAPHLVSGLTCDLRRFGAPALAIDLPDP